MNPVLRKFIQVQALLAIFCVLAISLLAIRVYLTGRLTYSFMAWNLFLACVPLVFAIILKYVKMPMKIISGVLFVVWLLFFPNATYMISDLLHLSRSHGSAVPNWYDAIMLFVFAFTGLIVGLVSLHYIRQYLETVVNKQWAWVIISVSSLLSGFGVYLGRFLRWNSWDVLNRPLDLLEDVVERVVHPISHYETYFITFVFTAILFFAYLLMTILGNETKEVNV